jgi:hypothetical protein
MASRRKRSHTDAAIASIARDLRRAQREKGIVPLAARQEGRGGRCGRGAGGCLRVPGVAELGGAVLLTLLGNDNEADLGGCWEYVRCYAGDEKIEVLSACGKVLDRTCGAVALILDTAEALCSVEGQGAVERPRTVARKSEASVSTP